MKRMLSSPRGILVLQRRTILNALEEKTSLASGLLARLRDFIFVLSRRFDPRDRDRALVLLAKNGCPIEEWKPILLWHMTRDEFLLRDFLVNWLFPAFTSGAYRVRPEDLYAHIRSVTLRGGKIEHVWRETTLNRVCRSAAEDVSRFWTSARQCCQRICWIPSPGA